LSRSNPPVGAASAIFNRGVKGSVLFRTLQCDSVSSAGEIETNDHRLAQHFAFIRPRLAIQPTCSVDSGDLPLYAHPVSCARSSMGRSPMSINCETQRFPGLPRFSPARCSPGSSLLISILPKKGSNFRASISSSPKLLADR
jgi:hypothetical protein